MEYSDEFVRKEVLRLVGEVTVLECFCKNKDVQAELTIAANKLAVAFDLLKGATDGKAG